MSPGAVLELVTGCAVAALLAAWVVLTILKQFPATRRRLEPLFRRDGLGLFARWAYFAPRPFSTDLHVLYRDAGDRVGASVWRELPLDRRRGVRDVFNPERRVHKAFGVSLGALTTLINREGSKGGAAEAFQKVLASPSYARIVRYVLHQPRDPFATRRQFAVVKTEGLERVGTPYVVFLSRFHELE